MGPYQLPPTSHKILKDNAKWTIRASQRRPSVLTSSCNLESVNYTTPLLSPWFAVHARFVSCILFSRAPWQRITIQVSWSLNSQSNGSNLYSFRVHVLKPHGVKWFLINLLILVWMAWPIFDWTRES